MESGVVGTIRKQIKKKVSSRRKVIVLFRRCGAKWEKWCIVLVTGGAKHRENFD
jgi:hypothetical protein